MSYYVNPHNHQCPWHPYAELFGSPNIKWCEETLCHWISEPANTYSNALYLIAAVYIFWRANRSRQPELLWFAPAMFFMGLFSFIYHMSNNYLTQIFDFVGMFLFVYWMLTLNASRIGWIGKKNRFPVLAALTLVSVGAIHVMYVFHIKFQIIVASAAIAIFLTEWRANKSSDSPVDYKFYAAGMGFTALAFLFTLLDGARVWCDPTNHWVQGHALWHVFSAIGLTLIYHHYEQFQFSERPNIDYDVDEIETQLEV
ncbi:MAG: ceramidase domain-containing protein [Bacteriovoracaceae bacterium]